MSVRFRPFGVWGSFLEVVVGFLMLQPLIWTHHYYGPVRTVLALLLSGAVLLAGIVGLNHAARLQKRVEGNRR